MNPAPLARRTPAGTLQTGADALRAIMEAWAVRKSPHTVEVYGRALRDFAAWSGEADPLRAIMRLLSGGPGEANLAVMEYLAQVKASGHSGATVNQRLSGIKAAVRLARRAGLVAWELDVEPERVETYRDTRGPGEAVVDALLRDLAAAQTPKATRDLALVRVMFDLGLRRSEVCGLDLEHLDLPGTRVSILGKGRGNREWLTLPSPTVAALAAWLTLRGPAPGPLFRNMDRAGKGSGRLTPAGLYALLGAYGRRYGVPIRPHGLRHTAITTAADVYRGDLRKVLKFSRHRKGDTALRYIDNLEDVQGSIAAAVAGRVGIVH
jgi:integrase/recombinase XerC